MIVAETPRLIISTFTTADAPFLISLLNTPSYLKYVGDKNIKTLTAAKNHIKERHLKSYKEHGFGFYKLQLKTTQETIGSCGLARRAELDHVDLGFAFLPEHEGHGYGHEASLKIMQLAKTQFNLKKLVAITLPTNQNSIKLITKLGFALEKKVKPFEDDEELLLFAKTL
ncbi:GCN5 family acetyltransferase [Mangrovimonas yunxiaonensis]|uniref:GCN5 family acetyltransferase n=1 Tax=Mangrovimonas yunxiaonensis TaxID=1197477 RepID=A0A084TMQ9_9FLAO|nr:GNAT family N-acetyltransferase [Mangrovimonas yunxiaonensis]KFB01995.1 GCN5 family acetyltransferase [Mangrovimonas yunxiaonensis]MBR9758609.1 GNAT family N-acetyltransferase [Algicola sp.]GGH45214.1 N-acetyltransferase GCN5 [Mangrovimonas yunxiaonensis]